MYGYVTSVCHATCLYLGSLIGNVYYAIMESHMLCQLVKFHYQRSMVHLHYPKTQSPHLSSIAKSIPTSPTSISHYRHVVSGGPCTEGESQCHIHPKVALRELTTQISFHPEGDTFFIWWYLTSPFKNSSVDGFTTFNKTTFKSEWMVRVNNTPPSPNLPPPPSIFAEFLEPPPSHRSWMNLSTTNVWCILPCWHIQIPNECLFEVKRLKFEGFHGKNIPKED